MFNLRPTSALALITRDLQWSYQKLFTQVSILTERLRLLNLKPGDVVWIEAQNSAFGLVATLACWQLDLCVVPIDSETTTDAQLRELSDSLTPALFIVSESEWKKRQNMPVCFVRLDMFGEILEITHLSRASRNLPNIAMIQMSSGTTGEPKKICLNKDAILWRAHSIQKQLNLSEADRTLCTVPISHSHGIDCLILPTLLAQGVLVLFDPKTAFPFRVLTWIEEYQITFFSSVPQLYHQFNLLDHPERYNLKSLRHAFCGSAALSEGVCSQFFNHFGIKMKQGYGLAEIGVITLNQKTTETSGSAIGRPIDGMKTRISAEGELVASSPGLFSYYLDEPQLTNSRLIEKELMTEDLVSQNSEGEFFLVGRKSDFLNILGQKFYPREVEDLLVGYQGITNSALVSENSLERGDLPVLHIESPTTGPKQQGSIERAIQEFLRVRLSEHKIPKLFCWHQNLPKNALGKVLRSQLRRGETISREPNQIDAETAQ